MNQGRGLQVKAAQDRVTIMIGGVGVSITAENSQRLRKNLIAAELGADRHIAATSASFPHWPQVRAEHDRVTIMIGGVGVSITTEDSRQLRKGLIAAELEADRHPRHK